MLADRSDELIQRFQQALCRLWIESDLWDRSPSRAPARSAGDHPAARPRAISRRIVPANAAIHPRRPERWCAWRFSLRTLFVVMTLLCVCLAVQVKWIRDRHEMLGDVGRPSRLTFVRGAAAPITLRLLGEPGYRSIHIDLDNDIDNFTPTPDDKRIKRQIEALFPEARVEFSVIIGTHPPFPAVGRKLR
jgi:hypothetical protein